ncbi:MAG: SPASM domain-containing protein [Bacteroidales bacterium]|nr:SPASM domain-containing protein [Bacteroidales bacterium]
MKFIHLLYVPTLECNMACKYCYLQENTTDKMRQFSAEETLKFAIEKFKASFVMPFNISLHGGEVSMLTKDEFYSVIKFINGYYSENYDLLSNNGFKVGRPHIKTNLFSIDRHIDTIKEFKVSISGSLDLPLCLHKDFRVTKGGQQTLEKILKNIELLRNIPNKKKVSATIFKEHFLRIDEIISDIKYLDKNTCLDMNDFNFMIGFDYNSNGILHALSQEEQTEFFKRMHSEFDGTNLDTGVNGAWFNEFSPEYCTNCDNCGEKFFLLEKNGDIFSCVRGQGHKEFFYGNIYENSVEEILETAKNKIFFAHENIGFNSECATCEYLYLCKTGCPFVKNVYNSNKSYTCLLQKELYKKRNYQPHSNPSDFAFKYLLKMHPGLATNFQPKVYQENSLLDLIAKDEKLQQVYDDKAFILRVNKEDYPLKSQLLKNSRQIIQLLKNDKIEILVKEETLSFLSDYPNNNALFIQLLSGDCHVYGDEQRLKQKHVATLQIYKFVLETRTENGYYIYDISPFLREYFPYLSKENPNNIFFTTTCLRDYHYVKQKNNAYYHIAAINLPFQNMEFNVLEDLKL